MTVLILKVLGVLGALVLAGWLYWLTAKVLLLLTYAEQLLGVSADVLALHPSKSADPTTAPDDAPAYVPYAGLREMDDDADRWADDGGPEPVRGPDTRPAAAVLIDHAFDEAETGPIPVVRDSADEALAHFTFAEGYER